MKEIWKDLIFEENGIIHDYSGIYEISNMGNIKRLEKINKDKRSKKTIKEHFVTGTNNNGYLLVSLCKNGRKERKLAHRLVAMVFIPNTDNKPQINHKNGKRNDNRVENLEWCTQLENNKHAWETGLIDKEKMKKLGKKYIELNCRNNKKPVCQLTKEGRIINKFKSIIEAEKQTGISNKHISSVCKNKRKTTGGYVWRYIEDCEIGGV